VQVESGKVVTIGMGHEEFANTKSKGKGVFIQADHARKTIHCAKQLMYSYNNISEINYRLHYSKKYSKILHNLKYSLNNNLKYIISK